MDINETIYEKAQSLRESDNSANRENRGDFTNDLINAVGEVFMKYNNQLGCDYDKEDLEMALEKFWEEEPEDDE